MPQHLQLYEQAAVATAAAGAKGVGTALRIRHLLSRGGAPRGKRLGGIGAWVHP